MEALKVQAVTARAPLPEQCSIRYRAYGAHLDDSMHNQYTTISANRIATHANETAGMVPFYAGQIVDTRFFPHPVATASFHEVWSNEEHEFPAEEVPYLTATPQYAGNIPDLYKEENFRHSDRICPVMIILLFRWR